MTTHTEHSNNQQASAASIDVYKRLLRQKGDAGHIEKIVAAVCLRLKASLTNGFRESGFEVEWEISGKIDSFEFRELSACSLFGLMLPDNKMPAALHIPLAEGVKLIDLMLGADPELEPEAGLEEIPETLTPLQNSLLQEFVSLCGLSIESVFELSAHVTAKRATAHQVQTNLNDHVIFNMRLLLGERAYQFQLLTPQAVLLKLNIRKQESATSKQAARGEMTPEKDVNIILTGAVNINNLTLKDIAALKTGDVISLKEGKHCQTAIIANGRKLHKCRIGQDNASYALLIEDAHKPIQSILTSAV